jgi:hypothetical protein
MGYSLDCKAIEAENADVNYKPKMPPTTMKETVHSKVRGNTDSSGYSDDRCE